MKRILKRLYAAVSIAMLSLGAISQAWAQSQTEPQVDTPANNPSIAQPSDDILRLEETIRANKEHPQVLTIVPWQLPTHQRIDETKAWQPVVDTLPSIERGQFLRDLAVVDDMLALSAAYAQGNNAVKDTGAAANSNTKNEPEN